MLAVIAALLVMGLWALRGLQHVDVAALGNVVVHGTYLLTDLDQHNGRHISIEKTSVLVTALATIFLAVATLQLRAATRQQVAADAPVLEINLYLPVQGMIPEGIVAKVEGYIDDLDIDDQRRFDMMALKPARFLFLEVRNVQVEPFSPARDIEVSVYLDSEDLPKTVHAAGSTTWPTGSSKFSPERMVRTIKIPVLGANCAELHPIFNVAPLSALECCVRKVLYHDLKGKKVRSAAYGEIKLILTKAGVVVTEGGYSEPAKWEMP